MVDDIVLVTGGAGYIGNQVVEKLLENGYGVTVLDSLLFGDESLCRFYSHPCFTFVKGDVRHIEAVAKALSTGASIIIDLAALVGDAMCGLNEEETVLVNVEATRVLAELSKKNGVERVVFASTCSVYGNTADSLVSEVSEISPISLYARTKLDSERILLAEGEINPCILRLGTVYGGSERMRFDLVVNLLAAKAVNNETITIFGGDQWRPLVHVSDVADAVVTCVTAEKEKVAGQVFNVGGNHQNYLLSEIGRFFAEQFPDIAVVYSSKESDARSYRVDFTKISTLLGFSPQKSLIDGVSEIKEILGRIQNYKDKKYYNVNYRYL